MRAGGGTSPDSPPRRGPPATSPRWRADGFTLLEILIVMVIIAVLATVVSLSVSGRAVDDRMEAESRRLEQLFRIASDEAQAKGLELGFRHTPQGFEFVTPDPATGRWRLIQDGMFRPRAVLAPFYLELRIDGRVLPPVPAATGAPQDDEDDGKPAAADTDRAREDADDDEGDTSVATAPQVLILSTGEMTAFTLDLKLKDQPAYYRLEGNALGELRLARGIAQGPG